MEPEPLQAHPRCTAVLMIRLLIYGISSYISESFSVPAKMHPVFYLISYYALPEMCVCTCVFVYV